MVYNYTRPRAPIAAMYSGPGPCYGLPGLLGSIQHDPRSVHRKNPAYTFGVKAKIYNGECSPGPCYLPNPKLYRDGLDGTPHYSLTSRHPDLKTFNPPGPGAYTPEAKNVLTRPPAYSMGTRTRQRRLDNVPAPNRYTLPSVFCTTIESTKQQAPCYSMRRQIKMGHFAFDFAKAPGAGTYDAINTELYKQSAPMYSMLARNFMPGDLTKKPGPGAHYPEHCIGSKPSAPAYTFGLQHSQYTTPVVEAYE